MIQSRAAIACWTSSRNSNARPPPRPPRNKRAMQEPAPATSSVKSSRIIERILDGIRESERICVVGHVRPDGDCIGSQIGLAIALKNQGKKVVCWNQDAMPKKLAFLDPDKLLQKPEKGKEFDCVIATDCASFERLGTTAECIGERKLLINIDHHQSNTRYGDVNWI